MQPAPGIEMRPASAQRHRVSAFAVLSILAPIALLFWLYRDAFQVWFVADDFAWLTLLRGTHTFREWLSILFSPVAQGTIRPWSEIGFFVLCAKLFGIDSLPLRICVFATMAANVALVGWLARRITGSAVAGFLAPVLWIANAALTTPISWNSAYNEVLCAFFVLSAFALFLRWEETGKPKFWWFQLVVFVLGFGALELNVVYPALAAAYALFAAAPERRKRLLLGLTPLFCLSCVYFVLHRLAVPLPTTGVYALHFDRRIFATLATYWHWAFVPKAWVDTRHLATRETVVWCASSLALGFYLVREVSRGRCRVLFFASWFPIALAPVLPLPDHMDDYYLTLPLIGLSMLAAWAVTRAWSPAVRLLEWPSRVGAIVLLAGYLIAMTASSRLSVAWWVDQSRQARGLVLGVVAAHRTHPDKSIVLNGISNNMFDEVVAQSAFYAFGVDDVFLTPDSAARIHPADSPETLDKIALDRAIMMHAITHDEVVVYSSLGDRLRNITREWELNALNHWDPGDPEDRQEDAAPRRVEAGNRLWAYLLGPEWYGLEPGMRWMPKRATLRLGGPKTAKERLVLEGHCLRQQLRAGPLHLSVTVDGLPLKNAEIDNPETDFERLFDLPAVLIGKPSMEVEIAVDRAVPDAQGRELGLIFGTIAVR